VTSLYVCWLVLSWISARKDLIALGFLRSYVSLVRRESDMLVARENGLLLPNLDRE
jgi:hypothetical protein